MFDLQKALYFASPMWLRRLYAKVPYAIRLGPHYRRTRRMLEETESWDAERLRRFQAERLRKYLRTAFSRVPYWRNWARREGAKPEDFQVPEDIRSLPLMSKDIMRRDTPSFLSEGRSRLTYFWESTGGTTGSAFEFPADNASYRIEQGYVAHMWQRVGYYPMAPKATLRGAAIKNPATHNLWRLNPIHNELNLSIYNMTDETLPEYVSAAVQFGPKFLHGYPSAILILAKFLLSHPEEQQRFPQLKAVLAASENIFPGQRKLIEEAFRCRLFTFYGMTERVIFADECEECLDYHCYPQYGVTEIVDSDGQPITEPGVEGELVGTGFGSTMMPFIRYRMGDFAAWVPGETCSHCGRSYPRITNIRGRAHDYLVGSDNRLITLTGLMGAIHGPEFVHTKRFQIYQDTPGKAVYRIVPGPEFSDHDAGKILHTLNEKAQGAVSFEIKLVDDIPLTQRGKEQYIIQKIKPDPIR